MYLDDESGRAVARLSARARDEWIDRLGLVQEFRVLAMVRREKDQGDPAYRGRIRTDCWEYPIGELIWKAK